MARSSGGGSRSGGSSSGSSRSGGSGSSRGFGRSNIGRGILTSSTPFPGCRSFRYYRNGTYHYIYSDTDLTQERDAKPRWILLLFYIPFIAAIIGMIGGSIHFPEKPMSVSSSAYIAVFDEAEILTSAEEDSLENTLNDFKECTGVTTQIITVPYDKWSSNDSLENYAYYRYYAQFEDENNWLLVYSELGDGYGEWYWEGIQGDNTIDTMDVFVEDFNTILHSSLMKTEAPEIVPSFQKAFSKAIDLFENQTLRVDKVMLMPASVMSIFIAVHAYFMVFFTGKKKNYSYKELEEVYDTNTFQAKMDVTCPYCGTKYTYTGTEKCPHCKGNTY